MSLPLANSEPEKFPNGVWVAVCHFVLGSRVLGVTQRYPGPTAALRCPRQVRTYADKARSLGGCLQIWTTCTSLTHGVLDSSKKPGSVFWTLGLPPKTANFQAKIANLTDETAEIPGKSYNRVIRKYPPIPTGIGHLDITNECGQSGFLEGFFDETNSGRFTWNRRNTVVRGSLISRGTTELWASESLNQMLGIAMAGSTFEPWPGSGRLRRKGRSSLACQGENSLSIPAMHLVSKHSRR